METTDMIKVMEHFANGGEVEFKHKKEDDTNWRLSCPSWDWVNYRYRIKQPRIIIEKWLLMRINTGEFIVVESTKGYYTSIGTQFELIKLLDTYEVEL